MIYRDNGARGAILDEYERALNDLIALIKPIPTAHLVKQVDFETKDMDCVSIQSVLSHVVRAGYNYAIIVRNHLGENITIAPRILYNTSDKYIKDLKEMFEYNEKMFADYPNIPMEEGDPEKKMLTSWGSRYDLEQLYEHAIVHILRHRRQIARFLLKV